MMRYPLRAAPVPEVPMTDDQSSSQRRQLLGRMSLIPGAVASSTVPLHGGSAQPLTADFRRTFFDAAEWALVHAICDRPTPHDDIGAHRS
jgi:hypothetical protein